MGHHPSSHGSAMCSQLEVAREYFLKTSMYEFCHLYLQDPDLFVNLTYFCVSITVRQQVPMSLFCNITCSLNHLNPSHWYHLLKSRLYLKVLV